LISHQHISLSTQEDFLHIETEPLAQIGASSLTDEVEAFRNAGSRDPIAYAKRPEFLSPDAVAGVSLPRESLNITCEDN